MTLEEAAAHFDQLVVNGEANGAVRDDVAADLRQVLQNALHAGSPAKVHDGLVQLRQKVEQRSREPLSITPKLANELLKAVDDMLAVAPPTPSAA
jgi:eukaryotic-like serine/threonine-protein kinase